MEKIKDEVDKVLACFYENTYLFVKNLPVTFFKLLVSAYRNLLMIL
jgi:hypothetical protein